MYQLSQIFISNFGHRNAYFPNRIVDLRSGSGVVSSAVLFAENGRGKTSFLSMILHMFLPRKRDFVQHLQKPHHTFQHYFHEGRPCLFMMEFVRQKNDILGSVEPALIIGVSVLKNGDDVSEKFFRFVPTDGVGFDDLEPVSITKAGEKLTWSKSEVEQWLKNMASANQTKPALNFKTFDSQDQWTRRLEEDGFRINDFRTMITMATREGGLNAFLEAKSSDQMLQKLHELFVDESEYTTYIGEINLILQRTRELPDLQRQLVTLDLLIGREQRFAGKLQEAQSYDEKLSYLRGKLHGLKLRTADEAIKTSEELEKTNLQRIDTERLVSQLISTSNNHREHAEGSRVAIAKIKYATAEMELADLESEEQSLSSQKAVFDRALPMRLECNDIEQSIKVLLRLIEDQDIANAEKLVPLNKAGTVALKRIEQALDLESKKLSTIAERTSRLRNETSSLHKVMDDVKSQRSLTVNRRDQAQRIQTALSELELEANKHLQKHESSQSITMLIGEIKKQIEEAKIAAKSLGDQLHTLNSESGRLDGDLRVKMSDLDRGHQTHNALASKVETIRKHISDAGQFFSTFTSETNVDLTDPTVHAQIRSTHGSLQGRNDTLKKDIAAYEQRLSEIKSHGGFEDADVQKALKICKDAGVKSVQPFAAYLAGINIDVEVAKNLVEDNLGISLGLIVYTPEDLALAKQVFRREEWKLSKPVAISLFDNEFFERLKATIPDVNFGVFSARDDYAYNQIAKLEAIATLEAQLEIWQSELEANTVKLSKLSNLLDLVGNIVKLADGKSIAVMNTELSSSSEQLQALEGDLNAIQEEIASITKSLEQCRQDIIALEESDKRLASDLAPLETLNQKIQSLHERLSEYGEINELEDNLQDLNAKLEDLSEQEVALDAQLANINEENYLVKLAKQDLETKRQSIRYASKDIFEIDDGTLDEALTYYHRKQDEYEKELSGKEYADNDRAKLSNKQDELRNKLDNLSKVLSEIAFEYRLEKDYLAENLLVLQNLPEEDRGGYIYNLRDLLNKLKNAKYIKTTEVGALEKETELERSFVLNRVVAFMNLLKDKTLDEIIALNLQHNEMAKNDSSELATARELLASLEAATHNLTIRQKDLEYISGRYLKRHEDADPIYSDEISFDDADKAKGIVGKLVDEESSLEKSYGEVRKSLNTLHYEVREFALSNEASIKQPHLFHKYKGFSADYTSRGNIGTELLSSMRELRPAIETEIEQISTSESKLVDRVSMLYTDAVDKILRGIKVRIPDTTNNQFAGAEILRLPEKIKAKDLREFQTEKIAQIFIDEIRQEENPVVASMNELSVRLLNIASRHIAHQDFHLLILKPVVGAKNEYDPLHKMTGSGGQSLTAALLLYLVATSISAPTDTDKLLGFLILDNPIGPANSTQLVRTQLATAEKFGIQMISTTGISDDYVTAYKRLIQFSASKIRNGRTEVDIEQIDNTEIEIDFAKFTLHSHEEAVVT